MSTYVTRRPTARPPNSPITGRNGPPGPSRGSRPVTAVRPVTGSRPVTGVAQRVALPIVAPAPTTLGRVLEQRFRKLQVPGSSPGVGSVFAKEFGDFARGRRTVAAIHAANLSAGGARAPSSPRSHGRVRRSLGKSQMGVSLHGRRGTASTDTGHARQTFILLAIGLRPRPSAWCLRTTARSSDRAL